MAGRINPFLDGSLGRRLARAARTAYAGRLRHPLVAVLGAAAGTALLALQVSNAGSYLSDAPEACINCHVMNGAYAGWAHSAHREEATCNDCHVPHDPLPRKVLFKMMDGARHTFVFTFHLEPQVMRLNEGAIPVVHRNCVRCHEQLVMQTSPATAGPDVRCWHCHRQTPHGLARSLSTSPHLRRPELPAAGVPRPEAPPRGVPGNDGARQE